MSTAADEDAYQRLIEPHRRELHAHCYRMLGSVQDAEDALQAALLRACAAFERGAAGSRPTRAWTYWPAARASALPIDRGPDQPPLTEIAYLEPYPDDPDASDEPESPSFGSDSSAGRGDTWTSD